ncbi:hypothetical protein F4777DRAFT_345321 [Nemania sp. FL0916]|nr:hypothetical protein F4777DRAFT_345321 [Nemania sp. FL0916]
MASASKPSDIRFLNYIGTTRYDDSVQDFDSLCTSHAELLNGQPVSPRIFQRLVNDHFETVIESRTFLTQELEGIEKKYSTLQDEASDEAARNDLERLSEVTTAAKDKFQGLLTRVTNVITSCAPNVYWTKHSKKSSRKALIDWLQRKDVHLDGLINSVANVEIQSELESVRSVISRAFTILSNSSAKALSAVPADTSNPNPGKRPLSDDNDNDNNNNNNNNGGGGGDAGQPPIKRQRVQVPYGHWWGRHNSKLSCSPAFFGYMRQFRAYIANPPDQPGSFEYKQEIARLLRICLTDVNMSDRYDDLLLMTEWNFRDSNYEHVRGPTFIHPGSSESFWRLGTAGWRGTNDFKRALGGGLTPEELSTADNAPAAAGAGMLALAHSLKEDKVRLRGGADTNPASDESRRRAARNATRQPFREPQVLWDYLLSDATYPTGEFADRIRYLRPPMMDPANVGDGINRHRSAMANNMPPAAEWTKVQNTTDPDTLERMADDYERIVERSERRARDFIENNPNHLLPNEPKLNEIGGRNRPQRRYKGLSDGSFARPMAYAFRARIFQTLRLSAVWNLYLAANNETTLADVLCEEVANLRVWITHERLYLEWENYRFFAFKSDLDSADLQNRYQSRAWLVTAWQRQIAGLQYAIPLLNLYPNYYGNIHDDRPQMPPPPARGPPPAYLVPPDASPAPTVPPTPVAPTPVAPPAPAVATPAVPPTPVVPPTPAAPPTPMPAGTGDNDDRDNNGNNNGHDDDDNDNDDDGDQHDRPEDAWMAGSDRYPGPDHTADDDDDSKTALEIMRRTRDTYENRLNDIIAQNNALDDHDPGNHAIMNRNNMDIMAKQQVIWSLEAEIENLEATLDPLRNNSVGRGARQRWELPENYWLHTRPIPPRRVVAKGVTTLGLGPFPGQHPAYDDPRLFLGAVDDFGAEPEPDRSGLYAPAGDSLFSQPAQPAEPAQPAAPGALGLQAAVTPQQPDQPGHYPPTKGLDQIKNVPKHWPSFLHLLRESQKDTVPTGLALLTWDAWAETAYNALWDSVKPIQNLLPYSNVFRDPVGGIKTHIRDSYTRRFADVVHDNIDWRERERRRYALLDALVAEINAGLTASNLPASFPNAASLGLAMPDPPPQQPDPPADPAVQQAQDTLNDLRDLLQNQNKLELTIHGLMKIKYTNMPFSDQQQSDLDGAQRRKRVLQRRYQARRRDLDAATRARADLVEQEERNKLLGELDHLDRIINADAAAYERGEALRLGRAQLGLQQAQTAIDRAAKDWQGDDDTNTDTPMPDAPNVNVQPDVAAASPSAAARPPSWNSFDIALRRAELELAEAAIHLRRVTDDAQRAQAAADSTNDSVLISLAAYAKSLQDQAETDASDASARHWLSTLAWQQNETERDRPLRATDLLEAGLARLRTDLGVFQRTYPPGPWLPQTVIDSWLAEAALLVWESYRHAGVFVEPNVWTDMVDNFWKTPGVDLRRMRDAFLYTLVDDLNNTFIRMGRPNILQPLPALPAGTFGSAPLGRAELLHQAAVEINDTTPAPAPATTPATAPASASATATAPPAPATNPAATAPAPAPATPATATTPATTPAATPASTPASAPASASATATTPPAPATNPAATPAPATPATPPAQAQAQPAAPPNSNVPPAVPSGRADAWPGLRDILQAMWTANIAYEVLRQQPGDVSGIPPGRPLWPTPVRKTDVDTGAEYYEL